jgi:hypothetical protein
MKLESYEIQTAIAAGDTDAAIRLLLAHFGLSHRESEVMSKSRSPMRQYAAGIHPPAIIIYFSDSSFLCWIGGRFSIPNVNAQPGDPSYIDLNTARPKSVRYRTIEQSGQ